MVLSLPAFQATLVDALTKPSWVSSLFDMGIKQKRFGEQDLQIDTLENDSLSYVQVVAPQAADLSPSEFQERVTEVYDSLRKALMDCRARQPLRFWNFVPAIHQKAPDGLDRYEIFNVGRFEAFARWYGTRKFGHHMVAASGVGHRGRDLVIQVLAARQPGRGVENPRQRAAYRYSQRYGPLPPCFARATLTQPLASNSTHRLLIVAGTASILGEDSCHEGLWETQLWETCRNLARLIEAKELCEGETRNLLRAFRELRVYIPKEVHQAPILHRVRDFFPGLEHLEWMPADLCRESLLVEIESVAKIGGNDSPYPRA